VAKIITAGYLPVFIELPAGEQKLEFYLETLLTARFQRKFAKKGPF